MLHLERTCFSTMRRRNIQLNIMSQFAQKQAEAYLQTYWQTTFLDLDNDLTASYFTRFIEEDE